MTVLKVSVGISPPHPKIPLPFTRIASLPHTLEESVAALVREDVSERHLVFAFVLMILTLAFCKD